MRSRIRYPTNFQIPTLSTFWGFRQAQVATVFKTSTFLGFHRAMVQRQYRLLFSPKQKANPATDLELKLGTLREYYNEHPNALGFEGTNTGRESWIQSCALRTFSLANTLSRLISDANCRVSTNSPGTRTTLLT
jgi:hypothetical protein